ncbi:hypothetical protein ACLKA7_016704 [Drosophila subpalustris]
MASECSKLTLTTPEQPPSPIPRCGALWCAVVPSHVRHMPHILIHSCRDKRNKFTRLTREGGDEEMEENTRRDRDAVTDREGVKSAQVAMLVKLFAMTLQQQQQQQHQHQQQQHRQRQQLRPTYASQVKTDNNSNNNDKAVADDNRIDIGGLTLGGLLDLPARR